MIKALHKHKVFVTATSIFLLLLLSKTLLSWGYFPAINQLAGQFLFSQSWWRFAAIIPSIVYLYLFLETRQHSKTYHDAATVIQPHSGNAHYERGIFHYRQNNFDAAMKDFKEVVSLLPFHPDAFVYIGLTHKAKSELLDAIAAFTNALNINSKNWYALYHRGCCKFEQGDSEGALKDLARAVEVDPKRSDSYLVRGYCYRKLEKYVDAIKEFSSVIEIDPKNVVAYLSRGHCHYLLGNAATAIQDFDTGIDIDPTYAVLYQIRGMAYGDLGYQNLAIENLLRDAELEPNEVSPWLNLVKIYRKIGDTEKAKYYLDKAIALKPDDPDVMLYHAIHQFNQNDPNALEKLDRLIELHPNRTDFLVTRAQALADMGEYARAIVDLDKIIAQKPLDWKHYVVRAKCKVKNGDPKGAIADCEVILRGDKKNDVLCAEIGQNLRIQNFWDESLTLHQAIVDVSPHCWQGWIGLADSARHLNNNDLYSQALAQTRTWIPKVDPYNLACLESVADNLTLAKEHLLIAFSEKPQCKAWAKEDPDLFWLRQDPSSSELF